jgi:heme-degrading monooxygenase HmoA
MFAVIYRFVIAEGQEEAFRSAWREMTQLIYQYEGSMGSRLHRENEKSFIAYALWPRREIWENSGKSLPEEAKAVRERMRNACITIETLHRLDMTDDLIRDQKAAPQ